MDWHEQHTLLKAAFSTTVASDTADFDTQWGRVSRATHRDTDFDAARFEVHESVPLRQQDAEDCWTDYFEHRIMRASATARRRRRAPRGQTGQ